MKVTVFGTGYVGLVTGACLADIGHHVLCMDVDGTKINKLRQGHIPIYEPGLAEIVAHNVALGTLKFTTDTAAAVSYGDIQFIAVGTPPDETGAADLQHVLAVAKSIGDNMTSPKAIVVKSTVPVGTGDRVLEKISSSLRERSADVQFEVISNPEFLKEGAAIADFQNPDRIVIGTSSEWGRNVMAELYRSFSKDHERIFYMDIRSAEFTKYAANAMLATKISFINEIANLAERLGANIEEIRRGIGSDPRIGYEFINPGLGYGGSCFPKDVQALARTAEDVGYDAPLIRAVESVNNRQKMVLFDKIKEHFGGLDQLRGKVVAVWGLAFKPNTDDMREAPSRSLMEALWAAGARVQAFDPAAMNETRSIYGNRDDLSLHADKYEALEGADALAICTEWQQFRVPEFDKMAGALSAQVIFDGRNMYPPERMARDGWVYMSIGRP